MASMYKRLHHNSFMLSAVLIFAAFVVIILVAYTSTNQPNLLMAAFGLSNRVFRSDNTPIEGKIVAAPIITTAKNSTLSILYTIPLGYGEPESIAVNPKTNTIYSVTTHYGTPSTLNYTTYKNNIVTVIDGRTNKLLEQLLFAMVTRVLLYTN